MKIKNICKYLLLVAMGAFALTACKEGGEETENIVAYFELYDSSDAKVSGSQKFSFGTAITYTIKAKNATIKSVVTPTGWTANVNETATACVVTPPTASDASAEQSGDVVFNLESKKVTLTEYRLSVLVSTAPTVTPGTAGRFKFGVSQDVSFTHVNAAKIDVVDKPAGWDATVDMKSNKITVTPPANMDGDEVGSGQFTFKAWEKNEIEDMTATFGIDVRLDGILNVSEQESLRVDYAGFLKGEVEETALDKYMQNGEIVLIADIGPVTQDCCITGNNGTKNAEAFPFKHTFNGLGHTMTLDIDTPAYIFGGLFQLVCYPGEVKNLTVDGTLRSTTTTGGYMISGGVAGLSDGGKFTNVTSNIAYSFATTHATNSYTNNHAFGGIVGKTNNQSSLAEENRTSYFTDCHSKGNMNLTDGCPQHVGGILGAVNAGSLAEFVRCSNSGNFNYKNIEGLATTDPANRHLGGIIGGSGANGATAKLTDCTNTGNITSNATGLIAKMQVGGIQGYSGGGTYINCKNTGDIYHDSANIGLSGKGATTVIYDRLGGIIGNANGANTASLVIENCVNEGAVSTRSNWTAGIIGTVENCTATTIKGCTNKGAISNNSATTDSYYLSGICGLISNATVSSGVTLFENCTNEGKISGNVSATAAGMLNRSNRTVTFKNCHNKGAIDVTTLRTEKSPLYISSGSASGWLPLVAGIAVVGIAVDYANSGIVGNFESCTNTGTIKAEVFKSHCIQNIWAAAPIHREDVVSELDASIIAITADESTTTAQANRDKITATIKTVTP